MKKKTKKNFFSLRTFFCLFILSAIALSFFFLFERNKQVRIAKELGAQLELYASDFSGGFSLAIYGPGIAGFEFSYNCSEQIAGASVMKIPILAAALNAIDDQMITFQERIKVFSSDIVGGSGILRRIDLPIELTFEALLVYMMAISDNTATNKVIDLLGFEYINRSFDNLGLQDTILSRRMMEFSQRSRGIENFTSSRDLTHLLRKIYYNQLFSPELSRKAKNIMLLQQHSDRIPLLLPEVVVAAHKTGLERGVVHDAGIVYGEKRDFVISILTKNVRDSNEAKRFIAQVSYLAYNLLN